MKQIAKQKEKQQTNLENRLKILEKSVDEDDNLKKYTAIKNQLDTIYDHITESILNRGKCDQYDHSVKSTRFFLSLDKQWGAQNTIKNSLLMIRILQTRHIF